MRRIGGLDLGVEIAFPNYRTVAARSKTTRKPRAASSSASPKRKSSAMSWDSMEDVSTDSWIASLQLSRLECYSR